MSVSGCADWVFVTYSVKSEFPGQEPEWFLADTHHACDGPASYFYVLSVIQSQNALDGTHTVAVPGCADRIPRLWRKNPSWCVCVCMYTLCVYMCVHMLTRAHYVYVVCAHGCVFVRVYMLCAHVLYVYVCTCVVCTLCVCAHTCTSVCTHLCLCVCTCVYVRCVRVLCVCLCTAAWRIGACS